MSDHDRPAPGSSLPAGSRRGSAEQSLLDAVQSPIFSVDASFRYTSFNRAHAAAMKALYGVDIEIGHDFYEYQSVAEDRERSRCNLERALAGEQVLDEAVSGDTPSNRRLFQARHDPIWGDDGQVVGVAVSARDLTEQRRNDESRAELATIIATSPVLMLVVDAERRVLQTTGALEEFVGRSGAEIRGSRIGEAMRCLRSLDDPRGCGFGPACGSCEVRRAVLDTLTTGRTHRNLEASLSITGEAGPEELCLLVTTSPFERDGERRVLVCIEDISATVQGEAQRAQLQEELRQSQKLEAVGQLAGGIAHDFNNLLSVILAHAEFALEGVVEGSEAHADLAVLRSAGQRAAALTRQLLAFGRRQVLAPTVVNLNRVLESVSSMLRRVIPEDIALVMDLDPGLAKVNVDTGQLEQVFMNLALNARDAMPRGGTLTFATANVELDLPYAAMHASVRAGRYVCVTVSDSGTGMDDATRARVFEPFFTTKDKGKGTGLGLSTAYGIVRQSGGNIWVYSEPGLGTTFKLYLPLYDEVPADEVRASEPAVRATGDETILVVEDTEALRSVIRRILTAAGYTVLMATNGREALQLLATLSTPLHLLLTDVVMPHMGGGELVQNVALTRPRLPVLYMSGYPDDAVAQRGLMAPGARLLGKPFGAAQLTREVRAAIDQSKPDGGSS